jgi:hypothetical protein
MFKTFKKVTSILLTIMLMFMSMHGIRADDLDYQGYTDSDGVVISTPQVDFGNVNLGESKSFSINLAVRRASNVNSGSVFQNNSQVIVSIGSLTAPLSTVTNTMYITLPATWISLGNNALSQTVSFIIKVEPIVAGENQVDIEFTASGLKEPTGTLTFTERVRVKWNGVQSIPTDSIAPEGSILINDDEEYTNSKDVTLSLSATDNVGVTGYRIALGNDASGASTVLVDPGVTPFTSEIPFALDLGDDTKTVAVQYRDEAGNWSENYIDTIGLDMTKPTLTWGALNPSVNGFGWHNSSVSLSFSVDDNFSGVLSALPISPIVFGSEGTDQTIEVIVTDKAGNVATFTSVAVNIDLTKPTGSILIDNGAKYTNKLEVLLSLIGSDANDIVAYQINDGDIVEVNPIVLSFEKDLSFLLLAGDGTKTVSVKYKDIADNWSEVESDSIILDQTAPTGSILINGTAVYSNDTAVKLSLNAIDNYEVVAYRIADGEDASTASEVAITAGMNFSEVIDWTLPVVDGAKKVSVQYKDAAGNWSINYTDEIILDQTAPELIFGAFNPSANIYGWNNTDVSLSYSASDVTSGVATVFPETPYVFSNEGENQTVKVKVTDNAGNEAEFTSGVVNIDKTAPTINTVLVSPGLVPVNTVVTLSVDALDELSGIAKYEYRLDGGEWQNMGGMSTSITPTAAYVHEIEFRVTDKADNVSVSEKQLLVVFDPDGGFVTGGGWIMSPEGAYAKDPTLTGKASFGFVSKYLKGASVPTGNTQFVFNAGGLNFHSTSYQWLVISGSKAQYKGYGNLNGETGYQFMLTATDGAVDMFRIKIWKTSNGEVVYDNQMGSSDSSELTTQLGGGSIVIHVPPKKR